MGFWGGLCFQSRQNARSADMRSVLNKRVLDLQLKHITTIKYYNDVQEQRHKNKVSPLGIPPSYVCRCKIHGIEPSKTP